MSYQKTNWKARKGTNLNRFKKSQETAQSVILENEPTSVTEPGTPFNTENMNKIEDGIADAHELIAQEVQARLAGDTAADTRLSAIEDKIPSQANASNKLADKDFVNSSVTAMAAHQLTYNSSGDPFPTKASLTSAATFYYKGQAFIPTEHDYCVVMTDETYNNAQVRYVYNGAQWIFSYKINDKPFTAAQSAAIDSGVTAINIPALTIAKAKKIKHNEQGQITGTEDLTKSDVGLGNVTNDAQVKRSEMGEANGVATLDANGTVPATQLPEGGGLLAVATDTSLDGNGTSVNPLGIKFPPENTPPVNDQKYSIPYKYQNASTVYNLNDFRTVGEYTLYNPASESTNFPANFGTGTSNAAILKVIPFYMSGTTSHAIRQELHKRGTNDIWIRYSASSTSWSAWVKIATVDDVTQLVSDMISNIKNTTEGIVYSTSPNMEATLADLYGGEWVMVTNPAPRTLTLFSFPAGTKTGVHLSGISAGAGSVVTIIFCGGNSTTTVYLDSNIRGNLQSRNGTSSDSVISFNSVTLQAGEELSLRITGSMIAQSYATWTSWTVTKTEYIYVKV